VGTSELQYVSAGAFNKRRVVYVFQAVQEVLVTGGGMSSATAECAGPPGYRTKPSIGSNLAHFLLHYLFGVNREGFWSPLTCALAMQCGFGLLPCCSANSHWHEGVLCHLVSPNGELTVLTCGIVISHIHYVSEYFLKF